MSNRAYDLAEIAKKGLCRGLEHVDVDVDVFKFPQTKPELHQTMSNLSTWSWLLEAWLALTIG